VQFGGSVEIHWRCGLGGGGGLGLGGGDGLGLGGGGGLGLGGSGGLGGGSKGGGLGLGGGIGGLTAIPSSSPMVVSTALSRVENDLRPGGKKFCTPRPSRIGSYSHSLPTMLPSLEPADAAERARAELREQRAARLEALLGGASLNPAESSAPLDEAQLDAQAEASANRACFMPRRTAASLVASSYLRAHELVDSLGVTDALEKAAAKSRALAASAGSRLRSLVGSPPTLSDLEDVFSTSADRESGLALECKEAGNAAYLQSNFSAAKRAYSRAVEAAPSTAAYHSNLAAALQRLGETDAAAKSCVLALCCPSADGRPLSLLAPKALSRLVRLSATPAALDSAAAAASEQAKAEDASSGARALAARLAGLQSARSSAKRLFDSSDHSAAEAAYSRALEEAAKDGERETAELARFLKGGKAQVPSSDPPRAADIGTALLLVNRAACRMKTGKPSGALEDATAALRLVPDLEKASALKEAAVLALRAAASDAATAQRDDLAAALAEQKLSVPPLSDFPDLDGRPVLEQDAPVTARRLPWGRASCLHCLEAGREAIACRASLAHRRPDFELDKWRLGGKICFRRGRAVTARGVSLGAGLVGGAAVEGSAAESGELVGFDWRSGAHTIRLVDGGLLRMRLRGVEGLSYEPPESGRLAH